MSADSSTVHRKLKGYFHRVKPSGSCNDRDERPGIGAAAFPITRPSLRLPLQFRNLRDFLAIVVVLGWVLASSAPAEDVSQKTSHNSTSHPGRQLFSANCAACHGLDGRGGERAPDIATRKEVQRLSDPELLHLIEAGVPGTGMPGFHSLGKSKSRDIVRYLRTLQGRQSEVAVQGNPQFGKTLFFGIAGCSQCHMIKGEGGFIGSDLANYAQTHSANEIREIITHPDQYLGARARITIVTTHDGKQHEGIIRNEDNFSLQLQSEDGAFHFFQKSEVERAEQQPKSLMPSDYSSRLTGLQLNDLISYLIRLGQQNDSGAKQTVQDRKHSNNP
jgi:cytochrome c oxidase cbb3-type subunit III